MGNIVHGREPHCVSSETAKSNAAGPIPVHMLTGFLGSGKTTLLNALVRAPQLTGTAVLINELGETAIDHDLVAEVQPDMMVTTTGCLCCTGSSDVGAALIELARRHALGQIPAFKRVIIETTGLADPAPVVATLLSLVDEDSGLAGRSPLRFELASVTTLFDIVHGDATLDQHFEAVKQVALADRIVLTKTDLAHDPATKHDMQSARRRLAELNPAARLLDRALDLGAIIDGFAAAASYDLGARGDDAMAWLAAETVMSRRHETSQALAEGQPRHLGGVRSHVLRLERPLDPKGFNLFLEMLKLSAGGKILRLKGLVALSDDPDRPLVVHGVQHTIYPVTRLDRWPSADRGTRLVFIGRDLRIDIIERMLDHLQKGRSEATSP